MKQEKTYSVYVMTNQRNTVLYTGITNDLSKRAWEHKEKIIKGFTKKYNIDKLVYYEVCSNPMSAIEREKQIKNYSRKKKEFLINKENSEWRDLSEDL